MKRTDMNPNTLYAILANGVFKPGYVRDPGKNPGKVAVRIYWRWEDMDDFYLNPQPAVFINDGEARYVSTADVSKPWADYCAEVQAFRDARNAERLAAEQAQQHAKIDLLARIEAVKHLLDLPVVEGHAYIDSSDLEHAARSDRMHDTRYSAMHVLRLVEAIAAPQVITIAVDLTNVHPDVVACVIAGTHLTSVDDDGYCNACGYQEGGDTL